MKKKFNVKNIVIFGVLGVVMVLGVVAVSQVRTFMSGASSDVEPQNVVVTPGEDGKSATVAWTSNKESISKVEYGTTAASLVLMSAETAATTSHSLSLSSLRPATTYYYRIRVGEEVFDNGGVPYSFKTKADAAAIVSPTLAPTTPATSTTSTPLSNSGKVCDPKSDYNKDGVVNSVDVMACKNDGGTVVAVPKTPKVTTAKTSPTLDCTGKIIDYNSDGVVNGLDRVNCLQSQR